MVPTCVPFSVSAGGQSVDDGALQRGVDHASTTHRREDDKVSARRLHAWPRREDLIVGVPTFFNVRLKWILLPVERALDDGEDAHGYRLGA